MISPRSFIYAHQASPSPPSSSSSSYRKSSTRATTSTTTNLPTSCKSSYCNPSQAHRHGRRDHYNTPPPDTIANKSTATIPRRISALKYDERPTPCPIAINNVVPIRQQTSITSDYFQPIAMGKRKSPLDSMGYSPPSPPESTISLGRPVSLSSPVQIPKNGKRVTSHAQKRLSAPRRVSSQAHLSGNISPSVAALLAVTDIPRMGSQRQKRRSESPMSACDIMDRQQMSEKEFSWSITRSPMDVLLSPPEEYPDDMSIAASECNTCSALSTRTMSVDSLPSLGDSFVTDGIASIETPSSPSLSMRRRKMSPMRRSLEPLQSPPGEDLDHPLSKKNFDVEDHVLEPLPESIEEEPSTLFGQFKPFRYAFKSNLTASIRALRSAAKSFSAINFSSIPSDDFLTRSLLTIDPNVPYADERRPPVTDDIPSAEVRRYLNPSTSPHVETHLVTTPPPRKFSASIQMQTYKVQRSKVNSGRNNYPRSSPQHSSLSQPEVQQSSDPGPQTPAPAVRQREMRENSDFIRIAVMEMAMRKRGKLDDQTPGRARWALPPRKTSTAAYKIGADGVPTRWIAITC